MEIQTRDSMIKPRQRPPAVADILVAVIRKRPACRYNQIIIRAKIQNVGSK